MLDRFKMLRWITRMPTSSLPELMTFQAGLNGSARNILSRAISRMQTGRTVQRGSRYGTAILSNVSRRLSAIPSLHHISHTHLRKSIVISTRLNGYSMKCGQQIGGGTYRYVCTRTEYHNGLCCSQPTVEHSEARLYNLSSDSIVRQDQTFTVSGR